MADKPSPTDARTYYHKGNNLFESGDYDKAIENYNMAIILNPTFSEAYFNRGLSYYNLKNFDKSISDYTKATELDPKNPVIFNNRGDAYYRKQDFQNAIVDYDKALAINKKYLKAFYNRGLAYACLQDYEKAVDDFTQVVGLNPEFAEAFHIRGLAYDYMNNLEKAIADYEQALKLNPAMTEAKSHLEIAKAKKDSGYTPPSPGAVGGPDASAGSGSPGGGPGQQGGPSVNPVKLMSKPNMTFKDVAGMDRFKEEIREAAVYPLVNPELAKKYGKLGGGGVLLYGPPGCGKTFLVKATAGECASAFINAKTSDILDPYVGGTEKNLHAIFETGRKNSPCIIFFDEVEAMGGRRDEMSGTNQYMKMAVNQLLYELDGVEANNANVLVIGATNAPWDVDPALRRSGRFSKTIYVPEPDSVSRREILKLQSRKLPIKKNIPWNRLSFATWGYSSADLKAVSDEAAAIPWREAFKSGKQREINQGDYFTAVRKKKSTLPPWYDQAKKQIGQVEEKSIVDGKEHVKISESKLGTSEKEAFKSLLDVVKRRSTWYYNGFAGTIRNLALFLPFPDFVYAVGISFVGITESIKKWLKDRGWLT